MAFPITQEEHDAIEARITASAELVVAAAVRTPHGIITRERPARHGDLWGLLPRGMDPSDPDCVHGFLTSHGRFVDRLQAGALVLATGQASPRASCNNHLFSEDLWLDLFQIRRQALQEADHER